MAKKPATSKAKAPVKVGRPSLRTPALVEEICSRISLDESLASICRDDGMPTETTVYRWLQDDDEFREAYVRARENQGHTVVDKLGDLRKKVIAGEVAPDAARVAADMIKWEAARRAAKYYGDATTIKHADANGEKIEVDDVTRAARLAALAAQINRQQDDDGNAPD